MSAALSVFAVSAAAAFAFAVVAAFFRTMPVAAAFPVPVTGMLRRQEFAVQAFPELFFGGVAHGKDLPFECEGLAGHRVVEVDGDGRVLDLDDLRMADLAFAVQHRHHPTGHEQVLAQDALHLEGRLRDIETALGVIGPIGLLRSDFEGESVSGLLARKLRLEFGEEHMEALDIVQRLSLRGVVHHHAVHPGGIAQDDHFVVLNLHIVTQFFQTWIVPIRPADPPS